ncbi:MAG: hypothetical protein KAT62_04405 [Desulfuromonadales bacterium]|nr:hypothetical protein [Chloroflexota bacterium]MCK4621439.1 hypothetical protein [Desulfuromonadales bacterium]
MKRLMVVTMLLSVVLLTFAAGNVFAAVKGACVTCHTMHNSQDGATVTTSGVPVEALLNEASCFACHTGTNTGLVAGVMNGTGIPYVYNTSEPAYPGTATVSPSLAGGNFYWVQTDDATGHNVEGVKAKDVTLDNEPPGWDAGYNLNGALNNSLATWGTTRLTCAGTNGCHGVHTTDEQFGAVRGAHHLVDTTIDGSTVGNSYRFLIGIVGNEDDDWEYTKTAADHNQYKGTSDTVDKSTISYLCAECHGQFHTAGSTNGENGTAPWLRHPTDLDMNTLAAGTEYKSYTTYDPIVPVASTDVSVVKSAINAVAGDAIVTCVSCHRAHGSPYADLLRWDYDLMVAGNSNTTGCFVCHTTKN